MPMFMLNGKQYGGNGGNYQVARMSKADYDALTDAQKNDGTLRIVVDSAGNSVNYMSAQVAGAKTDDTLTNLLNPTLQTTTFRGVTCTNNGDGTYTLNGTASGGESAFDLIPWHSGIIGESNDKLRLVGCPNGGSSTTFKLQGMDRNDTDYWIEDVGNGITFDTKDGKFTLGIIRILLNEGTTVNNLTFKPMLTTDLQATYDDFVGYTGGTGRLNSDVAEHEKEISRINSDLSDKTISPPLNQTNIDIASSIVNMYEKNGRVYVQGYLRNKNQLSSGSDVVVMTLPSQYRPKDTRMPWSVAYCYDLHATMLFYCDDSYNLKFLKPSASIPAGNVIVVNTSWEI